MLVDQVAENVATFNENRRNSVLSLTSVDAALADRILAGRRC